MIKTLMIMFMPICGSRILSNNNPSHIRELPKIPLDDDGPVFAEPWQAQVFAMTVKLHENDVFSWSEWTQALGRELTKAGPQDRAENYYLHWMSALEKLASEKGIVLDSERETRKSAWDKAARATAHGKPILLENG